MIRSTPHPPESPTTQPTPSNVNLGNLNLATIAPVIKVENALVLVSEYLTCAAATAYESADNSALEFRPLARAVVHQIEAAKTLVEAAIAGLGTASGSAPR